MAKYNLSYKSILVFLFLASLSALLAAYISQYFFGLQPCILCLYQRIPFFLVIIICGVGLYFGSEKWQKIVIKIVLLILLSNVALAFYHVGVEQKLFLFEKCSDLNLDVTNLEQLKEQIFATQAVRCDQPQFTLFTISMAGWNFLYCLIVIFAAIFAFGLINQKADSSIQ